MSGETEIVRKKFEPRGKSETIIRQRESAIEAFGAVFMLAFTDPKTTEIYRNEDGTLWHQKLGEPKRQIGEMDDATAMRGISICAGAAKLIISAKNPTIDTEFLMDGSRFSALIPPCVSSPVFNVRKKALQVFTLAEYVASGIMSREQCEVIERGVTDHKNILVIGGTGSGKTTLANAIVADVVRQYPEERIVIIEDTKEIQCTAIDHLQLHTAPLAEPPVDMTKLVRQTLRQHPDRILVGEVRGGEALDLLDAWNTGHEGGVVTLHSNNAMTGLTRLKSLVSRHENAPREGIERLIGEVVHLVVHIAKEGHGRVVKEVLEIDGWDDVAKRYVIKGCGRRLPVERENELLRRLVLEYRQKLVALGDVDEGMSEEMELLGLSA